MSIDGTIVLIEKCKYKIAYVIASKTMNVRHKRFIIPSLFIIKSIDSPI